mgnify:CR=1 FL=1
MSNPNPAQAGLCSEDKSQKSYAASKQRARHEPTSTLLVDGVDVLDGTSLLDIRPYSARFDRIDNTRNGWQDTNHAHMAIAASNPSWIAL